MLANRMQVTVDSPRSDRRLAPQFEQPILSTGGEAEEPPGLGQQLVEVVIWEPASRFDQEPRTLLQPDLERVPLFWCLSALELERRRERRAAHTGEHYRCRR